MSTISQVSVCNSALSQLGANQINSLTEGTIEANLCLQFFDIARTTVLYMHPWNFAITRIELAPDVTKPVYEFEYQFTLPADCLRVLQVYTDLDYRIEGRRILTNSKTCLLKYIRDVADVSTWSMGFVNTMIARMRVDLCYPLTKSPAEQAAAINNMERAMMQSKYIDASEDISDNFGQGDNSLITARGY